MPGMRCTVSVCNNSKAKVDKSGKQISFYRFPKYKELRQVWVQKCGRRGTWNPDNCRVCSEHFSDEDYEKDLQAELLNIPARKKLKASAVPSLKLFEGSVVFENMHEPHLLKKYEAAIKENEEIKRQLRLSREMNDNLNRKVKILEEDLANLASKFSVENSHRIRIEDALKHFLSKAQLDVVIDRKKKVIWSPKDVSNALAIRYFSKRCYVYLREKLKYPLPGISSLRRWASNLNLRQGIFSGVFRIMSIASQDMSAFEKVAVIQFGEAKVDSVYGYDEAADEIVGPHSQMQVAIVRGLFAQWKQPVYLEFDKKVTKDTLNTLITKLHEISYTVVACVSDCDGGIVDLWRELGIDKDHTYFLHPITGHNVYFFADAPQLLKLTRNLLLDSGFTLQDGTVISADPLKHLLASADVEVALCHKISKEHLECAGAQRQHVSLAAQLLSHSTATALQHYQPGPDEELASDLGNFIEKISNWFDVFNSSTTSTAIATKKPYGIELEKQNEILDEAWRLINDLLCEGETSLQIFQEGMLMSISSLKQLFTDMKEGYNVSYLFTRKVSQDALESFFSQLRGRDGLNDHPSPLDAIHRIRMIILGKNPDVAQKNACDTDNDEYITAKVILASITVPEIQSEKELEFPDAESIGTSPSSDAGPSSLRKATESDEVQHLAGWVAFKLKETHPELGLHTHKAEIDHPYAKRVSHHSVGGFMEPSEEWQKEAMMLNNAFENLHKKGSLRKGPKITRTILTSVQLKHPDINLDVAKCFFRQRTCIRIKFLNEKVKEYQSSKKRPGTEMVHDKEHKIMKRVIKVQDYFFQITTIPSHRGTSNH